MKHYLQSLALLALTCVSLTSCTHTIMLRRSPSDLVLVSVQPNGKVPVTCGISSNIENPYAYEYSGHTYNFFVNDAFKANFVSYFSTKFNKFENPYDRMNSVEAPSRPSDSLYKVELVLKKFDVKYDYNQSVMQALGNGGGEAIVDVSMNVYVKITRGGTVISEKNVPTSTQSTASVTASSGVETVYGNAVNEALSKSVIQVDKYLLSFGL